MRAFHSGAKFKTCFDIKVCVLPAEKRAIMIEEDIFRHGVDCAYYVQRKQNIYDIFNHVGGEYLE
jgi:hypothetical protein